MGEQGPKIGSRADKRGLTRSAEDDRFDAPEPTHSEARARRPDSVDDVLLARGQTRFDQLAPGDERAQGDADTKVERRASVRPSAFGAPRKSQPPTALAPSSSSEFSSRADGRASPGDEHEREPRHEPHERVLEAARLLDAVAPALREMLPDDLLTPGPAHFDEDAPRLPNQRARGVEHLVARSSAEFSARVDSRPSTPRTASDPTRASGPPPASSVPVVLPSVRVSLPVPPQNARSKRPWLSLVLFGGMIALSVVPLLRYAQSPEELAPAQRTAEPAAQNAAASLTPVARGSEPSTSPAPALEQAEGSGGREQLIASLLSEGNHALETDDIREAERMFGRALELAEDNPRAAYGLARIRLIQNNLSGAEGWIQLALRKRPRRAPYHALYAEVLSRMGRVTEARDEQARAGVSRDSDEP